MSSTSTFTLPYGTSSRTFQLPSNTTTVEPPDLPPIASKQTAMVDALRSPIGTPRLSELGQGAKTATIVINDITRPSPSRLMVDALLDELVLAGVPESGITLLVATGNHRPNTPAELQSMLGSSLCSRLRVVNHDGADASQLVHLGVTPRGVPVHVNRLVVEADLTILTGNIGPHQTAGFSGGRKSIMPGVASHNALRSHHSYPIRSLDPVMGQLEANAFHEEAVAAAKMVGVDFIVNTVKNSRGEIVEVVAGDLEEAHLEGVAKCRASWQVRLSDRFDATIVSAGGYPKDIDLHQAQKAVAAAELITRSGGPIVLVAECVDGTGKFSSALRNASSPREVIERFLDEGFRADEHTSKAYLWARALEKHPIYVVSDRLCPDELSNMFMTHVEPGEGCLAALLAEHGSLPSVGVVPYAVDCMFLVESAVPDQAS